MIILLEKARYWYEVQKSKVQKNNRGKIVIFVSQTIDSLSSLRILVGLFKVDNFPYEIIPVQNFDELSEKIDELQNTQIRVLGIVMINCVGDNDITNFWFCQEEGHHGIMCLVVDSRRPANHKNINNHSMVIIINDDMYSLNCCPTNEEMKEIENLNEEDYDELESEEEKDEKEEEGENKNKKRKLNKKKTNLEELSDEEYNENNIDEIANKEVLQSGKEENEEEETKKNSLDKKKEDLKRKRIKIETYYSGSYYGYPSAFIFYNIASQLHREDSRTLWYLIISITDEYLRYHFKDKTYDYLCSICQKEVLKLFNKKKIYKSDNDIESRFKSTGKEVKTIVLESDYRLHLYRHWNLYDSFIYSNYTLGVLSTWREPGKSELQKLFAYVGIPLSEAKQKYRYMKTEFKNSFKDKIIEISKNFDLNDLIFHSFLYQFDQNTEMSASDCVYLLSAVLEYPFDEIADLEIEDDDLDDKEENIIKDEEEVSKENENKEIIQIRNKKQQSLKKFWTAYAFLSLKKLNMTNSLIDLAIKFQIALANSATALLDKRGVASSTTFRYSIINSNLTDESRYFHYPGNLERLSLIIMETFYKYRGKNAEKKPFLLAMLDAENKSYLVNGNLGCNQDFEEQRNVFGIKFKYVAKKLGIKLKYLFNTDEIVSITKDDLFAFIQEISII